MRIAVDTMGGDHSPQAQVEGSLRALQEEEALEVTLVGPLDLLQQELDGSETRNAVGNRLTLQNADEVIDPSEAPVAAFRSKKDSSMAVAMRLVREGQADAVVSCGNTGALMAGGLLSLGRVRGVVRPAIATVLPTFQGGGFLMLDLGAHMEADERNLVQYAIMGSLYAERIMGIERPRVGLLNVGEEATKGRELYKRAHDRLSELPLEFVGNIEGRALFDRKADVGVWDGFVGNVVLKVIEAVGLRLFDLLRSELTRDLRGKVGGLLARPAFRRVFSQADYEEYGGAQLLGLRRPVVKCHGSSGPRAVETGLRTALQVVRHAVPELIETDIEKYEEG